MKIIVVRGKTQITDYIFLYNTVLYAMQNPDKIRLKIFYFSLEMSQEQKYQQLICHVLFRFSEGKIRITPKDLRSSSASNPLSEDILKIIHSEEYTKFFEFFEEHVHIIDSVRNGYGIFKTMKDYATTRGKMHKKWIKIIDNATKEDKSVEVDDYYEAVDPDEYVIGIVDHMALLTPENGGTIRDAMVKFSSEYAILLRNKYKYIIAEVIQQAASQEGLDNFKANKLRPSLDGYGEAKIISRDADLILGLFSPFRFEIPVYEKYDIKLFRDNIRFLEIIAGREGGGGSLTPLFFDGGVNYFKELPRPEDLAKTKDAEFMLNRVRNNKIIMLLIKNKK